MKPERNDYPDRGEIHAVTSFVPKLDHSKSLHARSAWLLYISRYLPIFDRLFHIARFVHQILQFSLCLVRFTRGYGCGWVLAGPDYPRVVLGNDIWGHNRVETVEKLLQSGF